MTRRTEWAAGLAALGLAAQPVAAADAGLTIAGVRHALAIPPGYCSDTAPARAYMKKQREAEDYSVDQTERSRWVK